MPSYQPLVHEYRADVLDLVRLGYICVVNERSEVLYHIGDADETVFYRSASKPIQALPVIVRGLDREFGLTERESAVFSGSHTGDTFHVEALESIWRKAALSENMMVMKPAMPQADATKSAVLYGGAPLRRAYHNCSGKHAALMLLQRALGGNVRDYWREDSLAQAEVKRTIAVMSEFPEDDVKIGIDGCGVPVFAVGMKNIAIAFKNLAYPDAIVDEGLRAAVQRYMPMLHKYPEMIKGTGTLCTKLNMDENIIAKGGANGLYAMSLKRERLGIAIKMVDGLNDTRPLIIAEILRQIGYKNQQTLDMLDSINNSVVLNDNGIKVGHAACVFQLSKSTKA